MPSRTGTSVTDRRYLSATGVPLPERTLEQVRRDTEIEALERADEAEIVANLDEADIARLAAATYPRRELTRIISERRKCFVTDAEMMEAAKAIDAAIQADARSILTRSGWDNVVVPIDVAKRVAAVIGGSTDD